MEFGMINEKHVMKKAGVSLVTVLLFMLVATIAATATYKWITSEGRSSASRMLEREAYQSSVAGIENAVSWMTYHANDVGALIRQYKNSGHTAVSLDNLLAPMVRPGQNFHVWLTGVNTSNSTYKLKLVSEGVARDGAASHREVAILNVDGLYRVAIPGLAPVANLNFDYNYFGGGMKNAGDFQTKSMLINGNLESQNNPIYTSTNLVVTGNVEISGSGVAADQLMCVGGNLISQNGVGGKDIYVHGNFVSKDGAQVKVNGSTVTKTLDGNVFVDGDIEQKDGNLVFPHHLKLNGEWKAHLNGYQAGVNKHLCLGPDGVLSEKDAGNTFVAGWSAYIENAKGVKNDVANYAKFVIGNNESTYVYSPYVYSTDDYREEGGNYRNNRMAYRKECTDNNAQCSYENGKTAGPKKYWQHYPSAKVTVNNVTNYQDDQYFLDHTINTEFKSRPGSEYKNYYWDDVIVHATAPDEPAHRTSYSPDYTWTTCTSQSGTTKNANDVEHTIYFPTCTVHSWFKSQGTITQTMPAANTFECGQDVESRCLTMMSSSSGCEGSSFIVPDIITTGVNVFGAAPYVNSTSCVTDLLNVDDANKLNNFDFTQFNTCYSQAKTNELYNGYLVVKFGTDNFFKSSKGSLSGKYIFILPNDLKGDMNLPTTNGAESFVFVYLEKGHSGDIKPIDNSSNYNYFIYTKANITQVLFNDASIKGSIYGEVGSGAHPTCAKVGTFQTKQMIYNQSLLDHLSASGIICNNNGSTCGGAGGGAGGAGGGAVVAGAGALDDYYIAVAPQLSITVESQYANSESIDNLVENGPSAEGSFIVLPRVIRLSKSPRGSLDQYYNVLPLNGATQVAGQSVNCNGIPATGPLVPTNKHKLTTGSYTCTVSGTVADGGEELTVPFYVIVSGADGDDPEISFAENLKELKVGDPDYEVKLHVTVSDPGTDYMVDVKFPSYDDQMWSVEPADELVEGECTAGHVCSFRINSGTELHTIFTVRNIGATANGSLFFEFNPAYLNAPPADFDIGSPYSELILASTKIGVVRHSLATWCDLPGNSGESVCARKDDPPCDISAEWIRAIGSQCSFTTKNDAWQCKNTADISLQQVYGNIPASCDVVIPGTNKATVASFENIGNGNVVLYASLLSKPFTFSTGFASGKVTDENGNNVDIGENQKIRMAVYRNGSTAAAATKDCSYSNSKNAAEYAEYCQIQVYYGDQVVLSFPQASDEVDFSYWLCESGPDCPSSKVPDPSESYSISVTGANTVIAHFGEKDKHCFFDIFRDRSNGAHVGDYSVRDYIWCDQSGSDDEYCIVRNGTYPDAKWILQNGSANDVEYNSADGWISLAPGATRTEKESEKPYATIMSRVKAGTYGTLKAQFQVPREGVSTGDISKSTVKQSGFILRSRADGYSYLMLNVFSDNSGNLKARVCLNGDSPCQERVINGVTINANDIILMEAIIGNQSANTFEGDFLKVNVYKEFSSATPKTVTFNLTQMNGAQNLANQNNEYVGFRLSDQNFKVYGIGWKSADYSSECWDMYPVITCSFKAAYAGGIVPKGEPRVRPWVGFSRWFGDDYEEGCAPVYYYNGSDGGCDIPLQETTFKQCDPAGYLFADDADGFHGDESTTARAGVNEHCGTVRGEIAPWLNSGEDVVAAHCGSFWVGSINHCDNHVQFSQTVAGGAEGSYFGIPAPEGSSVVAKANLRESQVIVKMDNPTGAEVRIYLFSQNSTSGYAYGGDPIYSLPYTTNASGTGVEVFVNVDDISQVDGFDPENVVGVYVQHDASVSVINVHSRCPYGLGLSSCRAEYNKDNDSWTVTATVTNSSYAWVMDVPTVSIGSSDSHLGSSNSRDCTQGNCPFTGGSDLEWTLNLEHTPYYAMGSSSSIKYAFTVTLTEDEDGTPGEGSPCKTSDVLLSGISTSCILNKNRVAPGAGIPVMTYSIVGCPQKNTTEPKCSYRIRLMSGSTDVLEEPVYAYAAVSGNVVDEVTDATAANGSGSNQALAEGDYTLLLESTNTEYPFPSCSQAFKVKEQTECTTSNHSATVGNVTIQDGPYTGGCYEFNTTYACKKMQIHGGNGSGKVTINGSEIDCPNGYREISITQLPTVTVEMTTCSITKFYLSECEAVAVSSSSGSEESSSSTESSSSVASSSSAVGISAACEIYDNNGSSTSSVFTATGNMKFKVTTHTATEGTKCLFTGTESKWNGSANANAEISEDLWLNVENGVPKSTERGFAAPAAAGTYTYTVSLNGSTLCSATLTTTAPLTCSAPAQVGSGATFSLTGTYSGSNCSKGYTHNMSGSGTEWPGELACNSLSQSFTAPTTPGNYSYLIGVDGSPNATCTRTVQVVRVAPTFDCKTGLKATIGQSNNVTIGLQNVLGCDEGGNYCYYGITGTGSISRSGNGYTSGNLPAFTDGTVTDDGTSKSYTVRLTNSVGYVEHDCSVEFNAASSAIELEITDGSSFPATYTGNPSGTGIPSGTCFTLTGKWNNCDYSPDVFFYCQHSANGLKYYKPGQTTPGSTSNNNFREKTGDKLTCTSTKSTFVESICVESDNGNNITSCGFGS